MEFSRPEYWSALPFFPLGSLPDPGMEPYLFCISHWQAYIYIFLTTNTTWESPWGPRELEQVSQVPPVGGCRRMSLCHQTFSFLKQTQSLQEQEEAATFLAFPPASQFSSVAQSCLTLGDPMDCSTPSLPVLHYLLELAQTHVLRVGDAFQPSHPLLSPSPPAFNLAQHQGLFH